ncbi:MAG: riboflavin synthase subunit alpha [Gammaproteobacteria bacterium SG8_11]|nr:MAG: riboflavin synthase subunit alpha [Gammaproteobacteria bacterium SG8_11]
MFTGIIQAIGKIVALEPRGGDVRIVIDSGKMSMAEVNLGDSIAVNGVCLTVVEKTDSGFAADVSNETLSRTTLKQLQAGSSANLEMALTPHTRLGGHIVSGHVDGEGQVVKRWSDGRSEKFLFKAPDNLAKYIAEKGSICVDGISLTVNKVDGAQFELNIVPHTLQETTMSEFQPGRKVNLEVDIIARYLERLILGDKAADPTAGGIDMQFLQKHGFI